MNNHILDGTHYLRWSSVLQVYDEYVPDLCTCGYTNRQCPLLSQLSVVQHCLWHVPSLYQHIASHDHMMSYLLIYIHVQQVLRMYIRMCVFTYVCMHILYMKVCFLVWHHTCSLYSYVARNTVVRK